MSLYQFGRLAFSILGDYRSRFKNTLNPFFLKELLSHETTYHFGDPSGTNDDAVDDEDDLHTLVNSNKWGFLDSIFNTLSFVFASFLLVFAFTTFKRKVCQTSSSERCSKNMKRWFSIHQVYLLVFASLPLMTYGQDQGYSNFANVSVSPVYFYFFIF